MSATTTIIVMHAARIRELHTEAHALAESAIERALEAGKLLAEVKATLPHGAFGVWVEESCGFTARTAQRYLRLHEHRDCLPAGAGVKAALAALKCDTVSHLTEAQPPEWLPDLDAVVCHDGKGRQWFAWRMDATYARAVCLTDYPDGTATLDGTKRGIRNDYLEWTLQHLGLVSPAKAQWETVDIEFAQTWHDALNGKVAA